MSDFVGGQKASSYAAGDFLSLFGSDRIRELKSRILFTVFALFLYRFGSYIPIPFIHPQIVNSFVTDLFSEGAKGAFLGVLNVFSGGAFSRVAIFSLGIMPYITASIIVQLSSHVFDSLDKVKKDGGAGRKKMVMYTRYTCLVFCLFQSFFLALNIYNIHIANSLHMYSSQYFMIPLVMLALTSGSLFLLWLGENITARGIGNGISLIIFSSIVAELPRSIIDTFHVIPYKSFQSLVLFGIIIFAAVLLVMGIIVYVERSARNLSVQYLHRGYSASVGVGSLSKIPLKINMSGVLPPIFANAFLASIMFLLTAVVARFDFFGSALVYFNVGTVLYMVVYAFLIFFFCFFYTSIIFDADGLADNLKRTGCVLPGKRPGGATAKYFRYVVSRITVIGSFYIVFVCLSADIIRMRYAMPFSLGGTSLLIVVGVVMDLIYNFRMYFISHRYDGLSKRIGVKMRRK